MRWPKRCPRCRKWKLTVLRRHMNTAYVDEESNWITECAQCFEITEEYWAGMWSDLHSGCL